MEFRILGPLEVVDRGVPFRWAGRVSGRCSRCFSRGRTRSSRRIGSSTICGAPSRRGLPRTRSSTTSRSCASCWARIESTRGRPGTRSGSSRASSTSSASRRSSSAATPESSREALALWRGPALADFAYESFARDEIARLDELRLIALERRIDADLEAGRHVELVPELEQLTRASAPRAPARSADARPLPLGPSGRGADGIPGGAASARRRARHRAGLRAPAASARDSPARPVPRRDGGGRGSRALDRGRPGRPRCARMRCSPSQSPLLGARRHAS